MERSLHCGMNCSRWDHLMENLSHSTYQPWIARLPLLTPSLIHGNVRRLPKETVTDSFSQNRHLSSNFSSGQYLLIHQSSRSTTGTYTVLLHVSKKQSLYARDVSCRRVVKTMGVIRWRIQVGTKGSRLCSNYSTRVCCLVWVSPQCALSGR